MMEKFKIMKIAIIGSGIAGITLANKLKDNFEVIIFEKSRGVGGRLSTRRNNSFSFNHGCPSFTANSQIFLKIIEELILKKCLIKLEDKSFSNNEISLYKGFPNMNSFLKVLSNNLVINFSNEISKIIRKENYWLVFNKNEKLVGQFDGILTSIPSYQASSIIPDNVTFKEIIKSIKMTSCFAIMIGYWDRNNNLSEQEIILESSEIKKIVLQKEINKNLNYFSIVVYLNEDWTKRNFNFDKQKVMEYFLEKTISILTLNKHQILVTDIQRWKYSQVSRDNSHNFFFDKKKFIGACGDWCLNGNVEGAFISASNLSNSIIKILNS